MTYFLLCYKGNSPIIVDWMRGQHGLKNIKM